MMMPRTQRKRECVCGALMHLSDGVVLLMALPRKKHTLSLPLPLELELELDVDGKLVPMLGKEASKAGCCLAYSSSCLSYRAK